MRQKSKTNIFFIFISTLFILIPRYAYHSYDSDYYFFPDSFGYIDRAHEIVAGQPLVHPKRLPLYPVILKTILPIKKNTIITLNDIQKHNYISFNQVENLQLYFGILGNVLFALIIKRLFGLGWKYLAMIIFIGMNVYLFGWEKNILTESISLNLMIIYLFFLYKFVDLGKPYYYFLGIIVNILIFLLKPTFFLITLFCLPILIYHYFNSKKISYIYMIIIGGLFSMVIPLWFLIVNKRLYNYNGITTVSDYNLMGKVIQYKLNTDEIKIDKRYDSILEKCSISRNNSQDTRRINDCVDLLNIPDDPLFTASHTLIGKFARTAIVKQPLYFVTKSILDLPNFFLSFEPGWIVIKSNSFYWQQVWTFLSNYYGYIRIITLAFLFFYPLNIYLFLKNSNKTNTIIALMGTIVLYTMIFITFFSHTEYDRSRSTIEPELLLFCYYSIFILYKLFRKLPSKI